MVKLKSLRKPGNKVQSNSPRSIRRSSFSRFRSWLPLTAFLALVGCGDSTGGSSKNPINPTNKSESSNPPESINMNGACSVQSWDSCTLFLELTDENNLEQLPDCNVIGAFWSFGIGFSDISITFALYSPDGQLYDQVSQKPSFETSGGETLPQGRDEGTPAEDTSETDASSLEEDNSLKLVGPSTTYKINLFLTKWALDAPSAVTFEMSSESCE